MATSEFVEGAEGVACRVAEAEEDIFGLEDLARFNVDTAYPSVLDAEPGHAGGEVEDRAAIAKVLAQTADDGGQKVAADVGLGVVEDLPRGAVISQDLEHLFDPEILDPGIELAVGVGAGAPFAEEQIALRVERIALEETSSTDACVR